MKLYRKKSGQRRIYIEDTDNYEVTEDNGVDFFPTEEQVKLIARVYSQNKGRDAQ